MDTATLAEMVSDALQDAVLENVNLVDWNDLGELTIVTTSGTFRATFERLSYD